MSPVRLLALFSLALIPTLRTPAADSVKTDDLKYLPAETSTVMVVRMDRLLVSDGFKKLRKEVPELDKEFESGFKKEFGFDVTNVVQMTAGFARQSTVHVGVLLLKNPVKVEAVVKVQSAPRFDGGKAITFKEEKVGKFTMYIPEKDSSRDTICAIDDTTYLMGLQKSVKAALEGGDKAGLNEGLRAALKAADPAALMTGAADLNAFFPEGFPPVFPGLDPKAIKESVSGVSITITERGADVTIRGIAVCKNAKAAEAMLVQAETLRKGMLEELKKFPTPKEFIDVLTKGKIATRGNLVEATHTVKADAVITMIKAMGGSQKEEAKPTIDKPAKPTEKPKPLEEKKPVSQNAEAKRPNEKGAENLEEFPQITNFTGRKLNEREKRLFRWRMFLEKGSPSSYLVQLESLGAFLGVPVAYDETRKEWMYKAVRILKAPSKLEDEDPTSLGLLRWNINDSDWAKAVMAELKIDVKANHFLVLFPRPLEEEFVKVENEYLKAHNLKPGQIDETFFHFKSNGKKLVPVITEAPRLRDEKPSDPKRPVEKRQ